nr:ATP-binding protein [Planococcus glaciei]
MITFLSFFFNLIAGYFLFGDPIHDLIDIWLLLMLNQGAITALAALLIEHILRQEYMLNSLMKHEKLETVSHFAASVSHELRNPLQSVKGFLQLMQEQEYSREKRLEFQGTMLEEIEAADQLINDYLLFAKPVQKQLEVLKVESEVEQVLKVMKPYAHWGKVEIRLAEFHGSAKILADKQKLHQALINIIRNGIEAMPDGGTLDIAIKERKNEVSIKVKDAGNGMTKEEIQRLGEPYFSTKSKGTGLGMMVTYSIIRQMGGEIQVSSEKGKGTSFTLSFPLV